MRYRHKHRLHASTVAAVKARYTIPFRDLAVSLGFSESYAATLCDVYHNRPNCISRDGEIVLRKALGLSETRDRRRTLHCSPELYKRLRAQMGELSQEEYLSKLADLWDQQ